MDCPFCKTPNPPGAQVCCNCQKSFHQPEAAPESYYPPRARDRGRRRIETIEQRVRLSRHILSEQLRSSRFRMIQLLLFSIILPGGGFFILRIFRTGFMFLVLTCLTASIGACFIHSPFSNWMFLGALTTHITSIISAYMQFSTLVGRRISARFIAGIMLIGLSLPTFLMVFAYFAVPHNYSLYRLQTDYFSPFFHENDLILLRRITEPADLDRLERGSWVMVSYHEGSPRPQRAWERTITPVIGFGNEKVKMTPDAVIIDDQAIDHEKLHIPLIMNESERVVPPSAFLIVLPVIQNMRHHYREVHDHEATARRDRETANVYIISPGNIEQQIVATLAPASRRCIW